jgi:hypothetical protein
MLTMLACDQTLQDQLNKTGRYTAELQRLVAEQQAIVCSAAQQPLPSLPTWAIPDVCSAAKAAIGDIDNIDIQNRLLSMLNGGLEVLVGGRPIVLLHAGLWGLLLLTTLTACESLAWLILLRFHAGRIAKMVIVVTLTCSWLASLIMCVVGIGGFYLLYTLCKTLFYRYNWDRIEYCCVVLSASLGSLAAFPGIFVVAGCSFMLQAGWALLMGGAILSPHTAVRYESRPHTHAVALVSLLWGLEIIRNCTRVIISIAVSKWYFGRNADGSFSSCRICAALPAPQHCTLTSDAWTTPRAVADCFRHHFGAVAFGSMLVATLRYILHVVRRAKDTRNPCLKGFVVTCLFCCIKQLRTFNAYSFVFVGLYNHGFLLAARESYRFVVKNKHFKTAPSGPSPEKAKANGAKGATRKLQRRMERGLLAACMSGVVEEVATMGMSLGGVFGAVAMAVPAYTLLPWYWSVLYAVVGFELGTILMSIPFIVLDVTSSTMFMCFRLNHEVCQRTKPETHARLCELYSENWPEARFCSCCGCCAESETSLDCHELSDSSPSSSDRKSGEAQALAVA